MAVTGYVSIYTVTPTANQNRDNHADSNEHEKSVMYVRIWSKYNKCLSK